MRRCGEHAPRADQERAMGYRAGGAHSQKAYAEAHGRAESLFGTCLLCRLQTVDGAAPGKQYEKVRLQFQVLHLRQARQERMHAPPHPGGGAVRRRTGRSAAGDTLRPPKGAEVCGVHQPQKHGAASAGDQHAAKGA